MANRTEMIHYTSCFVVPRVEFCKEDLAFPKEDLAVTPACYDTLKVKRGAGLI